VCGPNASRRGVLLGGLVLAGAIGGLIRPSRAWAVEPGANVPPIIACDAWGARAPSRAVPVWDQRPVRIIVHHTATANVEDYSRGAAESIARGIQDFHMDRRGWIDTGQNFTISRGGYVLEGRHRSLEVLREGHQHVEGAHCTGQNVEAVGIENEGTYSTLTPPDRMWQRLLAMCAYICRQYGIVPTEIGGHRDFKDTICPGDAFYAMLPRLRTEVADALGQPLSDRAARRASWPLLRLDSSGPAVEAAQPDRRTAERPLRRGDGRGRAAVPAGPPHRGGQRPDRWGDLALARDRAGRRPRGGRTRRASPHPGRRRARLRTAGRGRVETPAEQRRSPSVTPAVTRCGPCPPRPSRARRHWPRGR
jgi:hypothetical protein